MTKEQKARQAEAIEQLRAVLPIGSKVYTELAHVSRSGMLRKVRVHIATPDGIRNITAQAAAAIGGKLSDYSGRWTIPVGGCGFDAGFEVVYRLGHALYPKGFDFEGYGRNGSTGHDDDGGYALKHSWL
jgi:hypothetical protein